MGVSRRRLLALGGLLAAAPVLAQTPKLHRVGILTSLPSMPYAVHLEQLRKGLRELGYIEGRNLTIEARYADGKLERLPALASELGALPLDVLVTAGSYVTRVARKQTRDVPIVMAFAGDPVGGGFADSLSRPGGRITGLTTLSTQLGAKRLEILRQVLPKLHDVALLWNPDVPERAIQLHDTQAAAKTLRLALHPFEARRVAEIEPALEALSSKRPDALIVLGDALLDANLRTITTFAKKNRLVVVHQSRNGAELGALFSYGPSFRQMHYRAATYVDKILKGAKPADLPIEQPTRFELIVNLRTAKALGVTVPQSVLVRADEVIR
ncbi:MAG TPA: ABC transporter substrate-binding protein [Burkholderiales bacterium]|jgi:putative ABC transport system substrate-binding protein